MRWGSFSVYGVKLHLLCATNRVPLSYELTAANIAEVKLTEELLAGTGFEQEKDLVLRHFGDLAYRSETLEEVLAAAGILLVTERFRQGGERQQVEIALASLKREFRLGETLAMTLVGVANRIAAEIAAYTYGFYVNGCWVVLKVTSRSCGHENLTTLI